jgi:glutathione S-transferase
MDQPITLYYAPYTRAARVAFLLEELGVEYTRNTIDTAGKAHKTPEYLAIHPHGLVPALRHGDTVVFETVAICLYLSDRFAEKGLAPPMNAPERGAYYQWSVYSVATLEPAIADVFLQTRFAPEKRDTAVLESGKERFRECARVLTSALGGRPYLLGDRFTTADVLIGSMLVWAESLELLEGFPVLLEYASRVRARPAFVRA